MVVMTVTPNKFAMTLPVNETSSSGGGVMIESTNLTDHRNDTPPVAPEIVLTTTVASVPTVQEALSQKLEPAIQSNATTTTVIEKVIDALFSNSTSAKEEEQQQQEEEEAATIKTVTKYIEMLLHKENYIIISVLFNMMFTLCTLLFCCVPKLRNLLYYPMFEKYFDNTIGLNLLQERKN